MTAGLAVDDVAEVDINLAPIAIPARNFGALCVIGDSDVIDIGERYRQYADLDGVVADFGTTSPEYLAADLFFSQSPQPSIAYIGRWAATATEAVLRGGAFTSAAAQNTLLTTLQAIADGSLKVSVDGAVVTASPLDFSAIQNLNGAATVLETALTGTTVVWDANFGRFVIKTTTTGATASLSYATAGGTGTDVSATLHLTQSSGASPPVAGSDGETPLVAATAIAQANSDIYGITFASTSALTDTEIVTIAAYIEGAKPSHIFGVTTQESGVLDSASTTDIGALLSAGKYSRTVWQYSSSSPYAVASLLGRAFTVDFTANNSVITLMFKQEPGVTAELLNETQAATLAAKHGNVFVQYENGSAIIQNGVMSDGTFFDERHGTDWLQNNVQTRVFNLLYQSPTKIPQTDPGVHQIVTEVEAGLGDGVNNGLIAPGIWTSSLQFGVLKTGMALAKGYYVYAPQVASQSQTDREARVAPTLQCAIKLAGAVHKSNVVINVNR